MIVEHPEPVTIVAGGVALTLERSSSGERRVVRERPCGEGVRVDYHPSEREAATAFLRRALELGGWTVEDPQPRQVMSRVMPVADWRRWIAAGPDERPRDDDTLDADGLPGYRHRVARDAFGVAAGFTATIGEGPLRAVLRLDAAEHLTPLLLLARGHMRHLTPTINLIRRALPGVELGPRAQAAAVRAARIAVDDAMADAGVGPRDAFGRTVAEGVD